jgi:recombination protein RecR
MVDIADHTLNNKECVLSDDPLGQVVKQLSKLPGIGEKSASRLALFLLKRPADEVRELAQSLVDLKEKISLCSVCFNITSKDPCSICSNYDRDGRLIAVVEDFSDLLAIERTGTFRGKYHVLQGVISAIDGIGPHDLRISELIARIENQGIEEIIIATNPTVDGEATAHYLREQLEPLVKEISRIAYGLPLGGDMQYADQLTLSKSFENRRSLKEQKDD